MAGRYRRLNGPRHVLRTDDDAYPECLRNIEERPEELYVLGEPRALGRPSVSIVGARKATPYGLACARLAAACAVEMGVAVVTGAAVGCDQEAHEEALRRGGTTVAVLGSAADVVYPANAVGMLQRTLDSEGAIASLQPWGAPPFRWAFVRRNAVVAALSEALVICEAGMPSGTFGTAQQASDAGREILVFPGSVFSPNSTGSNYLIANNPDVIPIWDRECLEVAFSRLFGRLRSPAGPAPVETLPPREARLLESLRASPTVPGELSSALRIDLTELMRLLGALEMRGRVVRLVDGRYSLSQDELLAQKTYHAENVFCG